MSGERFSEEFKIETVKQITERNYPIGQVSKRLGVTVIPPFITEVKSRGLIHIQ